MPRKRIKSKKKNIYRFMELYGDLHCVLTWMPPTGVKDIDWQDKELVRNLWERHGQKIMNEWRTDPTNAGKRPKIWWHIHVKRKDFRILRYEDFVTNAVGYYNGKSCTGGEEPIIAKHPVYESQTAYLDRKGLLEDWEVEYFKKNRKYLEEDYLPY